ncbi:hypothetical protein L0669_09560 [Flavobacterium bizetiae]|uniref:hypothetical protein n=1 Tax=Flavobacterium bizetiae TaxID=2704140 RepID=UPI0021E97005|nr:hypothetical protein [Flavobacterium bizetiae]UTN06146.1 hypothetical protein L0669_09560 [Flavobacterium bizetiae]
MKTKLLLLLLLISLNSIGQEIPDGKKLGLVAHLTYVKTISEAKMTILIKDERYIKEPDKAFKFNSDYTLLKLLTDQLINQLSADLIDKNKLKLYRSLNKYLKNQKPVPEKFSQYQVLLEQIDGQLQALLIRSYKDGGTLSAELITAIVGIITEIREITTSARDFREKKIQSISGIIKELKLSPIAELIKPKEKDDKD